MSKLAETLFARFVHRSREVHRDRRSLICEAALQAARETLGISAAAKGESECVDLEALESAMAEESMDVADFDANVQFRVRCLKCSQLAEKEPSLKAAADKLAADAKAFDVAEATRHREALAKLTEMQTAAERATNEWLSASAAKSDLESAVASGRNDLSLHQELDSLNDLIAKVQVKLRPSGSPGRPSGDWGNLQLEPALLAAQTRDALDDNKVGYSQERREQLKSQLAAAERAVAGAEKELARLEKQRANVTNRLAQRPDDILNPANWPLIRAPQPSADERRKLTAARLGWSDRTTAQPRW